VKITLIEPAMIKRAGKSEIPVFSFQPLTLGVLAGLTPQGIEVQAIDDRVETINFAEPRDLVGISVQTFTARRAYQIADEFRRRGVPVVLGGYHPTLLPGEASLHADAIVIGEAEPVWSQLLHDAQRARLQPVYQSSEKRPFQNNQVDRAIFRKKHYLPAALVETARGCPHNCAFCAVAVFSGRELRCRPAQEVQAEIAGLGQDFIFFVDDNIVGNHQAAKELFRALIPLHIRWIGQASLSMTRDKVLMQLMQKSGCQGVLVGMETLDPANLRQIDKSWNTAGIGYAESLKIAREHGIAIVASFIVGLDTDTAESLDSTLDFAIQQRFFGAMFNQLMPYPGTRLYEDFLSQGRMIRPKWWLDPEYTYGSVVFKPKNISAEELTLKRVEMYRRFYGPASNLRRMLERQANTLDLWKLVTFLGMNLPASRQEALRFGKSLGTQGR
jgi:radical SAM superfamily enzyme YgiQ (UPF0313 family)